MLTFKALYKALRYSLAGLKTCFIKERAFRQEVFIMSLSVPFIFLLPKYKATQINLIAVSLLVLVLELLNSAIERVVDLISPQYSLLAKEAKDMASASVLLGLCIWLLFWAKVIYDALFC